MKKTERTMVTVYARKIRRRVKHDVLQEGFRIRIHGGRGESEQAPEREIGLGERSRCRRAFKGK